MESPSRRDVIDLDISTAIPNSPIMKTPKLRKLTNITSSRWLAYATAGAATVIGSAGSAEAEIHYSGRVNLKLNGHDFTSTFDLPLSGGASLEFIRFSSYFIGGEGNLIQVRGACDEAIRGTSYFASKLYRGVPVSTGQFSGGRALISVYGSGRFAEPGVGFAGFTFDAGNGPQYGWVRIRTVRGGQDNALAVLDYAWGDPGDKIRTGQKRSRVSENIIPTEGSLGLLGLGAAGLLAWRARRSKDSEEI